MNRKRLRELVYQRMSNIDNNTYNMSRDAEISKAALVFEINDFVGGLPRDCFEAGAHWADFNRSQDRKPKEQGDKDINELKNIIMNKLNWHRAEELKDYREDGNIVFLDRQGWMFHEARFCGRKDDGSPSFSCDGKIIDNNEIFLWCMRYNLLEITNFVQMIEPLISFTNNKKGNHDGLEL